VKTEALIAELARNVETPSRPARTHSRALVVWLSGTAVSIAIGTWILGVRADIMLMLATPRYVLEMVLILAVAASSGAVAVLLAYPGRFRARLAVFALATVMSAWLGALVCLAFLDLKRGSFSTVEWGYSCTLFALALAVVPAAILVTLVRGAAPTRPTLNALAIGIAALGAGALGLHVHCTTDGALHQFAWHGVPVVVLSALGASTGWRLLRW